PSPLPGAPARGDNLVGVGAMVGSMAAFVVNDVCVKLASATVPLGEIIALRNAIATVVLVAVMATTARIVGGLVWPQRFPAKLIGIRIVAEIAATILFLIALVSLPLADVTAIAQVAPLAMTAVAAVALNESVGWRRWLATLVGFLGVALIVRPGSDAFSSAGAIALISVVFIVIRDLATRVISKDVSTGFISLTSTLAGVVSGLLMWPFETWHWLSISELALVMVSGAFLAAAFALIVVALRTGDVSVVSPFRYTVIVFALIAGYIVWGETPDAIAFLGTAIVCAAGLYTLHRERLRRERTA
ncbi:MAG: DMT family transporter, partial [Hyphomicrobiaceae bacterium]|nr:DMT family transporter [Hyphomicrobiaceae bacterium]